ncbi:MAG: DUF1016 N-terminal domain-containing protein [Thermoguttaceae bacterium]|nr:DUF1016 N-terminal domain-containing protein [Thermoguttaceae bacterium]
MSECKILSVNAELVRLYWDIGRIIHERQHREGWGAGVIPRLAPHLKNELPDLKGFSERNIGHMIAFYREYPDPTAILQLLQNYPSYDFATTGCEIARRRETATTACPIAGIALLVDSLVPSRDPDAEGQRPRNPPVVHGADPRGRLEPKHAGDADRRRGPRATGQGGLKLCRRRNRTSPHKP